MKTGLVPYGDSSEEEEDVKESAPPPKKRKLPKLQASLLPQIPVDNPAMHQGRIRTTPHVEGQYAAYVYVPVVVERRSLLHKVLSKALTFARNFVPSLHPIGILDDSNVRKEGKSSHDEEQDSIYELHISLTRPTYLNEHQREEFKHAVKNMARSHTSVYMTRFAASFATFAELTNDERSRTFLTLEIGAGYAELKVLSDALIPTLYSIRQKEFYADPRFHVSVAWALLDRVTDSPTLMSILPTDVLTPEPAEASVRATPPPPDTQVRNAEQFLTIRRFPPSLVESLNREFNGALALRQVGMFQVEEICVRIGKEVNRWNLVG